MCEALALEARCCYLYQEERPDNVTFRWAMGIGFGVKRMDLDIDAPIKRTIDCVAYGLRRAGMMTFNDRQIVSLAVTKVKADDPYIDVALVAQYG